MILASFNKNIVIQKAIQQHECMSKLNESSVNTIRMLTMIRPDGKVNVLSSVVRMGRNGKMVDNASSGGIVVGIDINGRLKEFAYNTNGERFSEHPDSHIKFSTVTIPNFQNIKETVSHLVWRLPQFRMLSWDIAIDPEGNPILVEVNMHSGQLDFHQLCNGPVFGNMTTKILNEVFQKH